MDGLLFMMLLPCESVIFLTYSEYVHWSLIMAELATIVVFFWPQQYSYIWQICDASGITIKYLTLECKVLWSVENKDNFYDHIRKNISQVYLYCCSL